MDKQENKYIQNVILISIILTLVFISLTTFYLIKDSNNNYCDKTKFTDFSFGSTSNSSIYLDSQNSYVLQQFNIDKNDIITNTFCFEVDFDNSDLLEVEVINENEEVLGKAYINNRTKDYCININSDIKDKSYLGVKCNNCGPSNILYLQKETSGINVNQIKHNSTGFTTYKEDTLNFVLYGYNSCKSNIKWFFQWYMFLIVSLFFTILILIGWNKFKDILFKNV
jgi:hypothetical protein